MRWARTQHSRRLFRPLARLCLLAVCAGGVNARAGEYQALPTELKLSGPQVSVQFPLGPRYRPGCYFPLNVRLHNSGADFNAEIYAIPRADAEGLRQGIFEPRLAERQTSKNFTLPLCAPALEAGLALVVRQAEAGGGVHPELFRARLSALKPDPNLRLILACGRSAVFTRPGNCELAVAGAAELPEQAWMYDSVDLVVLTDGSFREASPAAKSALRQWLLGGGRVFVAAESALAPAISAGLLPLAPEIQNVSAETGWWTRHAGLKLPENVLAAHNFRPVYAWLPSGLGCTAFLFPGTSGELAARHGTGVFSAPVMQHPRAKSFDLRVQPERFSGFAYGSMSSERTGQARIWFVLGALMLCVVLLLSCTSRSRLESFALPLVLIALLAVMLARFFPEPGLVLSRISWRQCSGDGRACLLSEWTLVESFRRSAVLCATGPEGGTLRPLYDDPAALAAAGGSLLETGGRLQYRDWLVNPQRPALLECSLVQTRELSGAPPRMRFSDSAGKLAFTIPAEWPAEIQKSGAVLASAGGRFRYLTGLDRPGRIEARDYDDAGTAIRATLRNASTAAAQARAQALKGALLAAAQSHRDTLVCWGTGGAESGKSLVELDGAKYDAASQFFIYSVAAELESVPAPQQRQ